MIPPSPRSTLFPYTTLFRSKLKYLMLGGNVVGQEALTRFYALHVIVLPTAAFLMVAVHLWRVRKDGGLSRPDEPGRSEEHTSELQSHHDLVCRLLLEKKKNN